jgi:hypothetical protein
MSIRPRVPAIDDPDFVADVAYGDVAELRLTGTADSAVSPKLAELLHRLHGELQERHAPEIVVDMRGLEFMNADCFKELVEWLVRLQDLPREHRYRIRFRPNPTIYWQKRSLFTLSCFDTDLVTIET